MNWSSDLYRFQSGRKPDGDRPSHLGAPSPPGVRDVLGPVPKSFAYLQLFRPANLVTAAGDILAGYALVEASHIGSLFGLLAVSVGLYGGGVVLNDVVDAPHDLQERPERPIPSGLIRRSEAAVVACFVLAAAVWIAFQIHFHSGLIALLIAAMAIFYNLLGKISPVWGPWSMASCRGLNLLLGMSAVPVIWMGWWPVVLVPFGYILAITLISRGEVHNGDRLTGGVAFGLLVGSVLFMPVLIGPGYFFSTLFPSLILLAFMVSVVPAFWRAWRNPESALIRVAVKKGVLGLLFLDAAMAAARGGVLEAMTILLLFPLARRLSHVFAVT